MTTNTVVQLARFNSTDTPSNSEWTTNLQSSVILNQGDSISVKQAYIDSRLNSSGNIVIETDLPISLTYYFYMMFPCDGASTQQDPTTSPYTRTRDRNDQPFGFADMAIEGPVDYVNFLGTLNWNGDLDMYQGLINNYQLNTGIPENPTVLFPESLSINQSYAIEAPMLLVEWKNPAGGENIDQKPITKTWNYTIPAGIYSPSELADLITKKMSSIQQEKTSPNFTPNSQFGRSDSSTLNDFLIRGYQVAQHDFTTSDNNGNQSTYFPPYLDTQVQGSGFNFTSNSPAFADKPEVLGIFANFCTDVSFNPNYFGNTIYGDWDPEDVTNPIAILPSHWSGEYSFTLAQGSSGEGYYTQQRAVMGYATPIVGASEISLEYNQANGVMQFTYLHTPILQLPTTENGGAGTEPIEVVKIIKTDNINPHNPSQPVGQVNICEQTRHSGIFFQSMEPASFWRDTLGFDVPNITFDPSVVWGRTRKMTFEQFNKATTSGYVGIENNFNFIDTTKAGTIPNTNAPSYLSPFPTNQTESAGPTGELTYSNLLNSSRWILEQYIFENIADFIPPQGASAFDWTTFIGPFFYEEYSSALITTNPLLAIQSPLSQVSGTGHYLINIDGYKNTKNDFVNENDIYDIKSIVSNYYLSQNAFSTQPFSDSAIYVHNSPIPKVINSLKVRLIDPSSMKNALNIGPNSSVYLQINKIISDVAIMQTA